MDLYKTIRILHDERNRLDKLIMSLEQLQANKAVEPPAPRRGRKGMSTEERREVSERMKKYWAGRRTGAGTMPEPASAEQPAAVDASAESASAATAT